MDAKSITATYLHDHSAEVLREVEILRTRYVIVRSGRRVAVLVPIEDMEKLRQAHENEGRGEYKAGE